MLLPTFTDAIVQVPGGDGTYYWDTYYTQKPFTVDFAFDDLRDEDLRKLRQMFAKKEIQPLIFDEFPYKKYMVKCAQPPQLKYLCFDWKEFRIYKGEGTVQFVAYYPFAFAVISPYLKYDSPTVPSEINNTGDMPANMKLIYDVATAENGLHLQLREKPNGESIAQLKLNPIQHIEGDFYILIDTQTQLIEGLDNKKQKTGNLYNKYIESGDFFWPPAGRSYLLSSQQFKSAQYTPLYY